MRFFLDEDHSQIIAAIGRENAVDVVSAHEVGRKGLTDAEQLAWAAEHRRAVVTRNYDHFARLSREYEARGERHAGVVLVPRSLPNSHYAQIAAAIVRFDAKHPDGVPAYSIRWLTAERPRARGDRRRRRRDDNPTHSAGLPGGRAGAMGSTSKAA